MKKKNVPVLSCCLRRRWAKLPSSSEKLTGVTIARFMQSDKYFCITDFGAPSTMACVTHAPFLIHCRTVNEIQFRLKKYNSAYGDFSLLRRI